MLSAACSDLGIRTNTLFSYLIVASVVSVTACDASDSPFADTTPALELSATEVTIEDGDSVPISAFTRGGSLGPGTVVLDPANDLTWSSSAPSVASVTGGVILALSPGSALITATSKSGASASVQVQVLAAALGLEFLGADDLELPVLSDYPTPIRVKVVDGTGNSMTGVSVDFVVSAGGGTVEPSTVQTDSDGIATASWTLGHIAGAQTVAASLASRSELAVEHSVSALPGPPYTLVIPTSSLGLRSGQLYRLSAGIEDAYGNPIAGYPVIWTSSDSTVAAVDQDGLVSPRLMGATQVTAAAILGPPGEGSPASVYGSLTASTSVNVSAGIPATLEKGAELPETVIAGAPLGPSLIARATDFYGNPVSGVDVVWEVVWGGGALYPESPTTDEEGIARAQWLLGPDEGVQIADAVLPADAVSEPARAPGSGNGTGPSERVVLRFEVRASKKSGNTTGSGVASVSVSTTKSDLLVDESASLTAQVLDSSGNPVSGQSVVWSSSSSGVANVSGSGVNATVSGVSSGTSLISAAVGDETGWVTINVVDPAGSGGSSEGGSGGPAVASLALSTSATSMQVGQTSSLTVQVLDASGSPISGREVSWSSSNTGVVSVGDSGYNTTATGVSAGSSMITASVEGQVASVTLDVEEPSVASVTLSATNTALEVGETSSLTAQVLDALGNPLPGQPVTWSSSNTNVANVSGSGYSATATGVSAGSSVITASVEGQAASTTLDVEAGAPPPPPPPSSGPARAFPGAEGWGATALEECRSLPLQVHFVTNTNDGGSGSLRGAIESASDSRFDVIVFRTGGSIQLQSQVYFRRSCVYVAGQTAPGDGILVRGNGVRLFNNHDVVVRYMRFRDASNLLHIIDTGGARRIVFDHLSGSWATDGTFSIWRNEHAASDTRDITYQRLLSAESLEGHSTGMLIGGRLSERAHEGLYQLSVHHNLFAHIGQRNPEVMSGNAQASTARGAEVINNVQYNWRDRPISTRDNSVVDVIGNYSKPGPMTVSRVHRHQDRPAAGSPDFFPLSSIYISGNVMEGETFGTQWDMFRYWYSLTETLREAFRRDVAMPAARFPVTVQSASSAYSDVVSDVGANARISCDGTWVTAQDRVDLRIIADVLAGTGYSEHPPESPEAAGGWPEMAEGSGCQDSDADGLPDSWESRHYGCETCADPVTGGQDGYLLIEHYVNGTDPRSSQ